MEVDPVEVPPEAAGPSPKRPQENEENPDAPVKRPKYASENPDEVPEPAPGGADKREGKRKQNTSGSKKSKEKKDYVRVRRGTRADGKRLQTTGNPKLHDCPRDSARF
ncbi:hypothetical protein A0H81_06141 [Grifola frondosa]|uniref:Uncharacterized protein n=1 Tax=Grifola frondosa TaxID=5627 RepID=A0A1C7MB56_GRIFR|nr:hypothetical protein A0H81_06141 [Grifola frondosa]